MSTVSVVIPTYNCAEWLESALRSVVNQTVPVEEILVVDDGSGDNTREVLAPWIKSGSIHYIHQENRGLPGARNTGARAARGEYVAFLDADDELTPNAIQRMRDAADSSGASWCLADFLRVRKTHSEVQMTSVPKGDLFYEILEYNFVRYGMFFRKSELIDAGLYDESIRMCEDWELNIRMIQQRRPFVHVPEALYLYTQRDGSITTGRKRENLVCTEKVCRKHHKKLADGGDLRARLVYAEKMWHIARLYWYSVDMPGAALRCAWESLLYDFSLRRLLHPVAFLASKTLQRLRGAEAR